MKIRPGTTLSYAVIINVKLSTNIHYVGIISPLQFNEFNKSPKVVSTLTRVSLGNKLLEIHTHNALHAHFGNIHCFTYKSA